MSRRGVTTQVASSTPFDNDGTLIEAEDTRSAIVEAFNSAAPLRTTIPLLYNGTLSNNEFIGYTNLLPGDDTPIVVPITGEFSGFTFSNSRTGPDFSIEFRLNSTTGTVFYTYVNSNTQTESISLPTPETVTAGDEIYLKYIDQGTNAADAAIVLQFRAQL